MSWPEEFVGPVRQVWPEGTPRDEQWTYWLLYVWCLVQLARGEPEDAGPEA